MRILAAVLTFVLGVSTVWAASLITAGVGVLGIPLMTSEVINVDAPPVPEPAAVRFKKHKKHRHPNCRSYDDASLR